MLLLRAAQWRNALVRVGMPVPFWLVHDIGMLAIADPATLPIEGRPGVHLERREAEGARDAVRSMILEIATSEILERAREWRLSDDLLTVLLLKVLGPLLERFGPRRFAGASDAMPIDPAVYQELEPRLPELFQRFDRSLDLEFLEHVARERLRVITAIEQIDLDTLRLVGMFGAEAGAASALEMLDLLRVFESPEANDIVNFSLDLLPSVLETKRASGQQSYSVDGYAGVSRRGTLDSLMLSELVHDPQIFAQRFMENELFYYAREKQHEEDRRLHYLLVDASASMRGKRSVFARGLALTLIKKLQLQGEEVYMRFFDSKLYEVQHSRPGMATGATISVPYVLCFRGERGRNYGKVFGMLVGELARLAKREKRTPIVYIITHAQCHVPVPTIERLRRIARLYGIFMLPSEGALELEYTDRLHTLQIVEESALNQKEARARRALDIVEDAASS